MAARGEAAAKRVLRSLRDRTVDQSSKASTNEWLCMQLLCSCLPELALVFVLLQAFGDTLSIVTVKL